MADPGLLEPGNIDLSNRPRVRNKDGSISTVRSIGVNVGGKEVLLPTVSDDGRIMSDSEAVDQYRKTGKHLGVFSSPAASTAYAQRLHKSEEKKLMPDTRFQGLSPEEQEQLASFYGPDLSMPAAGASGQAAGASAPAAGAAAPVPFDQQLAAQEKTPVPQVQRGLSAAAQQFAPVRQKQGTIGPAGAMMYSPLVPDVAFSDYDKLRMQQGERLPELGPRKPVTRPASPTDPAFEGAAASSSGGTQGQTRPDVDLAQRGVLAKTPGPEYAARLAEHAQMGHFPPAERVAQSQSSLRNDAAFDARTQARSEERAALPWYHPAAIADWMNRPHDEARSRGVDVAQRGVGKSAENAGRIAEEVRKTPATPEQIAAAEAQQNAARQRAAAEEDAKVMRFAKYIGESDPTAAADLIRMMRERRERESAGGTMQDAAAALKKAGY